MSLLKSLQETTIAGIDSILAGRKVSLSARKLIETGVLLNASSDPVQKSHGYDLIRTAVRELEPSEEPASPESPGLKTKDDKLVQEELLNNNNPSSGNTGSEQSTENTEPYTSEGTDAPSNDIKGMQDATGENQMKENIPMMPPTQMGNMMMPGMDPNIAQDMGKHMGQIPPMSTPQQMQQMQYMLSNYHKRFVAPLNSTIKVQRETIQKLAKQVQETQFQNGSRKLDLDTMHTRSNQFNGLKETVTPGIVNSSPTYTDYDKNTARHEIAEMNNRMNEGYIQ